MRILSLALGLSVVVVSLVAAVWIAAPGKGGRAFAQERPVPNQGGSRGVAVKPTAPDLSDSIEAHNQATKRKFAERMEATFEDAPLAQVLEFLTDQLDLETFTQRNDLEAAGLSLDAPVTLKLKRVRADTLLDLALRQVSPDLGYVVRDGIVIIATKDALSDSQSVRVYNCRDLLGAVGADAPAIGEPPHPGAPGAPPSGLPGSGPGVPGAPAAPRGPGGGPHPAGVPLSVGSGGFGGLGGVAGPPPSRAEQLQRVIRATVAPETWDTNGGPGTMEEFGGLLVVNQSEGVHDRIDKLLQMIREAAGKK